ncbi:MAG: RNA 2',3'-cyclic phosphodiesterase [Oscillospiraceae bacterium]|nr:RNA 2',3'-cyclic phosphodiesterase [Oscillospiraceae bacterium]
MRLFIALNFSDVIKESIVQVAHKLRVQIERGRFTAIENLHMTLVFVGQSSKAEFVVIQEVIHNITFAPLTVIFNTTGYFNTRKGNTWWVGDKDRMSDSLLTTLRQPLVANLSQAGIRGVQVDSGQFTPHVTIARDVVGGINPWTFPSFTEQISSIDLMKSELIDGRIVYSKMYEHAANSEIVTI